MRVSLPLFHTLLVSLFNKLLCGIECDTFISYLITSSCDKQMDWLERTKNITFPRSLIIYRFMEVKYFAENK